MPELRESKERGKVAANKGDAMQTISYRELEGERAGMARACEAAGLTVRAEFVPHSKSADAGETEPRLHWRVELWRGLPGHDGRRILATDYTAGCAHAPSYQQRKTRDSAYAVAIECEHGKRATARSWAGGQLAHGPAIWPDPVDVIACIVSDASAIDAGSFEEWASEFGYDADSRNVEAIYQTCIAQGLALRAALGDAKLAELREALRDW